MLLTRSPLTHPKMNALDLHVLSTPPAFVLSQDQTLQQESIWYNPDHSYKSRDITQGNTRATDITFRLNATHWDEWTL